MAATRSEAMPRIEIAAERRRAHRAAFRTEVVAASALPGARVQDVAERYGICPSLIYRWRRIAGTDMAGDRMAGEGTLRLFPVRIADASPPPAPSPRPAGARRSGSIEIEIGGDVRVRVDESVSLVALRRVLSVLRG